MWSIAKFLKPYAGQVAVALVLVVLQVFASLGLPTVMAKIVDVGIPAGNLPYIWKMGALMLGLSLLQVLVMVGVGFFSSRISSAFGRDVRRKVFEKVESSSMAEVDRFGISSLITRTTNDITQVQNFIVMLLRMVVTAPIMFIGSVVLAIGVDRQLSLVIVAALPLLMALIILILVKASKLFASLQVKIDRLNQLVREHLAGTRVIRAFVTTKYERKRFDVGNADLTKTTVKVQSIASGLMPGMMIIMNLTTVAVMWFGGVRVEAGGMQVGQLMSFVQYVTQILMSVSMLSMLMLILPRATVSAKRINEVLDVVPRIVDPPAGTEAPKPVRGEVRFDHVTFAYPGALEPVLHDIDFVAEAGKTTAIIGATGSGKSTVLNLIDRLYDVDKGSVRIDGTPVTGYRVKDLRDSIGFVPQKGVLFSGTIADNIRYGNEAATDGQVRAAAKTAQALGFIEEKPEGFDDMISQGGKNVSGGQKQRLAIARALVRKVPVYMFDDSFSALDFKTDAALRAALKEDVAGSTVIIVAQRISTIMQADKIIVLDGGKIVGMGCHRELLETCPLYREIASSQLSDEELAG